MHRRPALVIVSLVLGVILGGGTTTVAAGAPGDRTAATPRLPACAYLDIKTRFMSLKRWRHTSLDTRLRVGPKYAPDDLVSVSRAGIGGSGKVPRPVIELPPAGDGRGGQAGRQGDRGPLRVSKLRRPTGHVRILGAGVLPSRCAQEQCATWSLGAPAGHGARLPECDRHEARPGTTTTSRGPFRAGG